MADLELGVDPTEVINRAAQYDSNLIQRVIAELQRDMLIQRIQEAEKPVNREVNTEDGE